MASARAQAVKVGVFVSAVATILVLALALIGGLRLWRPVDTYLVVTEEAVSGVNVNSVVTLRGVAIGKVKSIALDHTNFAEVRIELEIDPKTTIPAGSKAYFERVGLTGERVIDIHGGTLADGRIAPGSEIPRGQTDLERLQARADHLGDDLSTLVADMTKTVRDIETLVAAVDPERVTGLVEAVDPERVEAIVVHTERATRTLASTSKQLQRAVGEARADLDTVTKDVDEVANQATKTLEHADVAAKSLAGTIADADTILKTNEDDLRVAVQNLRQMAQDAKALVKALREQPSLLLRSGSRREARRRKRSERRRAKKSRKKPHAERGHD